MRISDWSSDVCSSDLAGLQPGRQMSGNSFKGLLTGGSYAPNDFVFAQRGAHADMLPRTTVAFDLSRCVIGPRYKLIYNVLPTLPYAPVDMSGNPFWKELAVLNNSGQLDSTFRSEEHTSELQSLMRKSYAVFCLIKKTLLSSAPTISSVI